MSGYDWECPKAGCGLSADDHNFALAIEHIYEGTPSVTGRDFDAEESGEVADRIIDRFSSLVAAASPTPGEEQSR